MLIGGPTFYRMAVSVVAFVITNKRSGARCYGVVALELHQELEVFDRFVGKPRHDGYEMVVSEVVVLGSERVPG